MISTACCSVFQKKRQADRLIEDREVRPRHSGTASYLDHINQLLHGARSSRSAAAFAQHVGTALLLCVGQHSPYSPYLRCMILLYSSSRSHVLVLHMALFTMVAAMAATPSAGTGRGRGGLQHRHTERRGEERQTGGHAGRRSVHVAGGWGLKECKPVDRVYCCCTLVLLLCLSQFK